jgi:hypothetical protein
MTQVEMIEKESETLRKLTDMLKETGDLLDRANESDTKEGKRALLSQAYETLMRFKA